MFYLQKDIGAWSGFENKALWRQIVVWLYLKYREKVKESGLILALDSVRDPGNLGTILRLCDWFGFEQLLCSKETVDIYNPSTGNDGINCKGKRDYVDINSFVSNTNYRFFGTLWMAWIFTKLFCREGIIIMGNEANGISEDLEKLIKIDSQFLVLVIFKKQKV
jgi:TrmH family RNA methyltransferase